MPAPIPPAPSPLEVRGHLLDQHLSIRRIMSQVETLATDALRGNAAVVPDLRQTVHALFDGLVAHVDEEDRVLPELFRSLDPWGVFRADQLAREHETQRAWLEQLLRTADDPSIAPKALAGRLLSMMHVLRADMEFEERETLSPDVLCDPALSIWDLAGDFSAMSA